MKFEMTSPCENCPFRTDKPFFLGPERAREIADALFADKTFSCHKTVDYAKREDYEDGEERATPPGAGRGGARSDPCLEDLHRLYDEPPAIPGDKNEQHCAGAMIILERLERPNQMMRICERLGLYDRRKLKMDAPVFEDFDAFVESMEALEGRAACRRRVTARDAAPATSRATARPRTASGKKGKKRKT